MRDDRQWNLKSLLLVASMPSWLVGDAKAKSSTPKKKVDVATQPRDGGDRSGSASGREDVIAAGNASSSNGRLIEDTSARPAEDGHASNPSDGSRIETGVGRPVAKAGSWPSVSLRAPSATSLPMGVATAFQTAHAAQPTETTASSGAARSGMAGDASAVAAASASSAAETAASSSGPILMLGKVPKGPSAADIVGYMPSSTDPKGQPSLLLCCGGCGYINCPTRLLEQVSAGTMQLGGQKPGSGLPDGKDYVPTGRATFGVSASVTMSLQQVAPLAGNWRDNVTPVTGTPGQLPGGGETGTGTKVGTPTLSGRVTSVTMPQARAQAAAQAAAATQSNPVVLENQKQGNPESEWGISGAGDSNIEGFATDISINRGSTIDFKINTSSNNYRIDIYRLGYYGGMGARKVATIQHTGVQNQPNPLRDGVTGAVDAGNWAVSASWAVPADAVSGVYVAKLVRQDGTAGQNHIPFIVRDDSSHSNIIFQTSDTTWQAYNGWGGANFYGGDGPATGQGGGRAFAVSYNRPIATRGGVGTYAGPQDYLFGAEYAAISWLEQNGYDVSYMAGVDVDRYGSLLLNHNLYLDVGHDEYWSGQQRTNVQAARDAGVNLAFWSGNEMYWRTRWGNSFSSDNTPYRTLISYKETWANSSIDPSNEWTGTFRDPRFSPPAVGGGSPENALTGTIFQVDDVGNALQAITVPYDDANLRFWRNTTVANLQPGQTATLTKNYLGYEWDEAPDNGFDPAGLVKLSSTTLPVSTYLLDYGNTTGSGTSTHNLTLYRAPSGALVFGAGTVYWSWGLSDNHDNQPTPTDARVQQAMVNLFADMGIQPATLQSGLISGLPSNDHTAPTSTINVPGPIAAGGTITISGTATDAGGGVIAGVEVSTDNGSSWHPATGDESWTYTWKPQLAGTYQIRTRAVDDSVNLETPTAGRAVTVSGPVYTTLFAPEATPAIVNTTDASAVELGVKFQSSVAGTVNGIRYYKSSQDTGTHTGALWSSTGTKLASLTFTNETTTGWQIATFSSPVTITPGVTYTASYHTNVGRYSATTSYFTSDVTNGPLTAPAAGNGVYTYGATSLFPTSTVQNTNFWVDVLFVPATPNTAPTAVADLADATEKGGVANGTAGSPATGNVLANDTDPDSGDTKTVTAIRFGATSGTVGSALAGAYGSLMLAADGSFTYTISENNAAVQALRLSTNTLTESYNYTMRDASGATSSANITVTIHGANDAPTLAQQTPSQNAITGSAFSLALPAGTFSDVDAGDTLTYSASLSSGAQLPAWLSFDPATRTFSGTPAAGDLGSFTVRVTATDLGSLAASETFNLAVTAAPNTTPTAVADTGDATEKGGIANGTGGSPASGNVLANDIDPDAGDTKTVTAVSFGSTGGTLGTGLAGAYGSLVLNADGTYTYTINENNAAVQALRLSTNTLTETYSYTMRDSVGATSAATLTITVHGANDAPVLAAQTANQAVNTGALFTLALPAGTFTDIDTGDTLTYGATSADGSPLPSWLTFNASNRTFSGTPASANIGTLGVKVTATDAGGLAASENFNIVVSAAPVTVSLFNASTTPALTNLNDGNQIELGVKFQSSAAGQITGIRFYRSVADTGQNVVNLWTSAGANLASATFSNTTATGWQTVSFSAPVTITPNTTYVASYHTTGGYVATNSYFTSAVTSGVLTAPSSASSGGNGVYNYGGSPTAGVFPNSTWNSSNYFADVVFVATTSTNAPPTAVADAGDATEKGGVANATGGSTATGNVLTNDTDPDPGDTKTVTQVRFGATAGTLGTALAGAFGSLVLAANGAYTYTINETNASVQALRLSTNTLTETYSYTMRDTAGATSTANVTITLHGANDAPVLAVQTGNQTAVVGSPFSLTLAAGTFTDVDQGDTLTYSATASGGAQLPSWLAFDSASRTFTGTPAAGNIGTLTVQVTGTDAGGLAASENFNIIVSATPNTAPTAVADVGEATEKGGVANGSGGSAATGNVLTNDTDPDAGDTKTVSAIRFGTTNGTVGTALAGTYGSLVLNANGTYTYTINETNAAVQALRLSTNTLSEVFTYTMRDTAGATSSANLTITVRGANDAPVLAAQTANQNAVVGTAFSLTLSAGTFTDVDTGDALTYTATQSDGTALPAWLTFNASTRAFTGTAAAGNVGTVAVRVTATDIGGLSANETFNIAVSTAPTTVSIFSASSTPTLLNLNDGQQLELGMKFTSSVAGQITALKFYRSANDTGQNVLDLWTSTGTKLTSVAFTNTSASGWQTVPLATPVNIAANTTYVTSYHTTGAYVATNNFFANAVTSGVLTAPSSSSSGGNGLYRYGGSATTGVFPNSSWNASNYYADVVFQPNLVS